MMYTTTSLAAEGIGLLPEGKRLCSRCGKPCKVKRGRKPVSEDDSLYLLCTSCRGVLLLAALKRDVRLVVADLADDHECGKEVREGIAVLQYNSDRWWMKRHDHTCWQWISEACRAVHQNDKAAYFDKRHDNRDDDLAKLIPYVNVIRQWKHGKLVVPGGLTPKRKASVK